ncbi:MAG: hypothetical protein MHPSP_000017 [Paramarteilia canceri]
MLAKLNQRNLEILSSNISTFVTKGLTKCQQLEILKSQLLKTKEDLKKYRNDTSTIISSSNCIFNSINSNNSSSLANHTLQSNDEDNDNLYEITKSLFNTHLVYYFFENGYILTALSVSERVSMDNSPIIREWFSKYHNVYNSIENHSLGDVLSWINENKSRLRRINSKLEFLLQRQEYLQLLYQNNIEDAIRYAKKWPKKSSILNEVNKNSIKISELPKLLGLLVYIENIDKKNIDLKRYTDYLNPKSMWSEVVAQFHRDNLTIFSDCSPSLLTTLVTLGISVLQSR